MALSVEVSQISAAADRAARTSYGRLLAYLTCHWQDVAAAEDALSDAFLAALTNWPKTGIPEAPDSWLLTVARRKLIDEARRAKRFDPLDLVAHIAKDTSVSLESLHIPEERARLMFLCTHPAIDPAIRPALILQLVLGLDAKMMASAFLVSPDTMTKRLVRAKKKMRDTGMRFELPDPKDMPERLSAVLEAIYAAYFLGVEGTLTQGDSRDELRGEAIYLARIIATMLPENGEALGFLALMLFCEARRSAQVDGAGDFVPLLEQDPQRWDEALMRQGYEILGKAAGLKEPGVFQIEAAIHAAHCYRAHSGLVPWQDIAALYDTLVGLQPTLGALVSRAVAHAFASGQPEFGLKQLDALNADTTRDYQPWWVARGHLLVLLKQYEPALTCLHRALGLTSHPRLRRFLTSRINELRT
jgi:RNA polymerase sigma-70 factor (ECF subfamily)